MPSSALQRVGRDTFLQILVRNFANKEASIMGTATRIDMLHSKAQIELLETPYCECGQDSILDSV